MKRFPWIALALLAPAAGWAASPLEGTWQADLDNTLESAVPLAFELRNGSYLCRSCIPPYTVRADGKDHPVAGHPDFDTMSVAIIDERTVLNSARQRGRSVSTETFSVSADGNAATDEVTDRSPTSAAPRLRKSQLRRVSAGPPGSHAISGRWRTETVARSPNSIFVTFHMGADSITMTDRAGRSYTAPLDGTEAAFNGDPDITRVSVKKIDDRTIEETRKRGQQVVAVIRWSVDSDGRTLQGRCDDLLRRRGGPHRAFRFRRP